MKRFFLIVFLWVSQTQVSAQTNHVLVDENFLYQDLSEKIEYYIDETNLLTVDQVELIGDEKWRKPHLDRLSFGVSPYTYWFRFYLEKSSVKPEHLIMEADYAALDEVVFYKKNDAGIFESHQQGSLYTKKSPFSSLVPTFEIISKKNISKFIYVRIHSTSTSIFAPMSFWLYPKYLRHITFENIALGAYYGIFIFLILYNFFLGISLKDKSYVFYILYNFGLVLNALNMSGHISLLLSGEWYELWRHYGLLSLALCFFFIPFANKLMGLREKLPWINITVYFAIFWAIVLFILTQLADFRFVKIINYSMITMNFSYLVISIWLFMIGQRSARFFFPALTFMNIGVITRILLLNGLTPVNTLTQWSAIIGVTIESILLSFALGDRINTIKRDKETAQQEALKNKELAIENLKKSDEIKNRFLANTSHELRTPLHGIIGLTNSLLSSQNRSAEDSRHRLELVSKSAYRLNDLINDILDYASMAQNKVRLHKSPVHLGKIAGESISLLNILALEKNITFLNNLPARNLAMVDGDERRILQIFSNLLGNAVKYNRDCIVSIDGQQNENFVEVTIRDEGEGIPLGILENIFRPFLTTAENYKTGVGLGLSITKELVDLHNGKIEVSSEQGKGTMFMISLPIHSDIVHADIAHNTETPKIKPMNNDPVEIKNSQFYDDVSIILAVDDEQINLEVYKSHLQSERYLVITARSASEADKVLESVRVDLILLDIMMSEVTGFDFLEKLRKKYSLRELPVILVSARDQNRDLAKGLNCGANDYLLKPFEMEQLAIRVENQLSLKNSMLSNQISLKKHEQAIFEDLHDHLGSYLTDLKMMFKKLIRKKNFDESTARMMENKIDQAVVSLRGRLSHAEDMVDFENDFLGNLHSIMLRRYVNADRELRFEYQAKENSELMKECYRLTREILYQVIAEIVTNDLKYGNEMAAWKFFITDQRLNVHFSVGTFYSFMKNKTGKGTSIIQRRLSEVASTVQFDIKDNRFTLIMNFPLFT